MIFQSIGKFIKKNASGLLTLTGIFGFGVSCYATAKAYQECKERIRAKKEELQVEKLPVKEVVKVCWKPCVLPLLSFSTSTICILGARNILLKEKAAYAALYKATETALAEFKAETKKEVGAETFKKIQDKATENVMQKEEVPAKFNKKEYYDDARVLWYDAVYGGYFRATELEIYQAFEELRDDLKWANNTSLGDDYRQYVPLSNLYWRLHQEPITIGDDYGYDVDKYKNLKFDYQISDSYKSAPSGEKALVLYYDKAEPIP